MAQMVKNPPAMWETWIHSLGWEDPLEEGVATHSSVFAWRLPMDRGAWWATYSPRGRRESDRTERLGTAQPSPSRRKGKQTTQVKRHLVL